MSVTTTLNAQEFCKPALSAAVHVTVVVMAPGNWLPEAGEQVKVATPALAEATALNMGVAYDFPELGTVFIFAGHVIVGFMVFWTTMIIEQLVFRPY